MKQYLLSLAIACTCITAFAIAAPAPQTEDELTAVQRWKVWRADLDYLYQEIEKPSTLKQILKAKGIEWKQIRKEADKRFSAQAKAFKKIKRNDPLAQGVEFYGILNFVVGQLRDTHAYIKVDDAISKGWKDAQPIFHDAGIEFLSGTHDILIVSNTFAGRGSNSPLYGKGVRHEATYLESVDGVPALKYFEEKARRIYEDVGWQSTYGRAWVEALNGLNIAEGEGLKLVFQTIESPEDKLRRYLELDPKKRARAFKDLKWKSKKVSLRATECTETRNPRNFRFMAIERPEMTKTIDDGVHYGRLPSGNGYVAWYSVSGKTRAGLDEACEALADCPGLVLDMRLNGGGGESGIGAFHNREGSWDKPVAVLMGPKTMSQGETEIWSLRDMREARSCNARLFGQTTAGSSGAKIQFALPSGFATGQFVCRHWHGGRSTIEGNGIQPDEVVVQDLVELSLGIDSVIARAEEWLASQ